MYPAFILVTEISETLLSKGLIDFAKLYSRESFVQQIELHKEKGAERFLILFPNVPSFDRFCFAVNYLHYLESVHNKLPTVSGYYLNNTNRYHFLTNGYLKIYVSSNDKAYDNVNVVNSNNETYLFDFGERHKRLSIIEQSFEVPELDLNDFSHVLDIIPEPVQNKPWWKFW